MTGEHVRIGIALGLLVAVLLLRLQAQAFNAAEYDEPDEPNARGAWTRLSWYGLALILLFAIYRVHPQPHDVLYMVLGPKREVLAYGLPLGLVGALLAGLVALARYGSFRLPSPRAYPNAALNSVATAVVDELAFRAVLQGMLLAAGLPNGSAVLIQTAIYALVTRSAAPGRPRSMLVVNVAMGLAFGWATWTTGGIGAAIFAHCVTTFALFLFTGHAGHVALPGTEPEEVEAIHHPEGWVRVPRAR